MAVLLFPWLGYMSLFLLLSTHSSSTESLENTDNCIMTLVLPKEKIKHSCDVQEQVAKKLDYLEGQVLYQKKVVQDLENMLLKERLTEGPRERPQVPQVNQGPQTIAEGQGTQPLPDQDFFIPLPDLSDDYPDFTDFFPPDVVPRVGQNPASTKSSKKAKYARKGLNLMAIDLLKPYIDHQIFKLRQNLTGKIDETLHPFAAGFDEVRRFTISNQSRDTNTLSPGAQTSMNTMALSHIFPQMTSIHSKLLHMNTQNILLQKKVNFMETQLNSMHQEAGHQAVDLRSRVLQLEHENQLLRLNQSFSSQLTQLSMDVTKQIEKAKSEIKMNCKTRRRPRLRARVAQGDYEYDEEEDNIIDDDWKPLVDNAHLEELEKNITALQYIIAQQAHYIEESTNQHLNHWNNTDSLLKQEIVDRQQGDLKVRNSTQTGLRSVQQEIDQLNEQVTDVSESTDIIQNQLSNNHQHLTKQLSTLKELVTDLHEDTALNFTKQNNYINNFSRTMSASIKALEKTDEENSLVMKSALGKSNQKVTENRRSILEWRDRVWDNNVSLTHLNTELQSLSEQVFVSVHSLNESVINLRVQLKINNDTWLPFNFSHSNSHVKCYGEKYVKRTNYASGSIVGVVLCTKDMYKIFLSDSLSDTFLNIADSNGFGHDHCEFVGGMLERTTQLGHTPVFYKKEPGYKRQGWGGQPLRTFLGIMNPSPEWYRCGISIPN